jgi:hypothetical protein
MAKCLACGKEVALLSYLGLKENLGKTLPTQIIFICNNCGKRFNINFGSLMKSILLIISIFFMSALIFFGICFYARIEPAPWSAIFVFVPVVITYYFCWKYIIKLKELS